MTDFKKILEEVSEGQAYNPYAGQDVDGSWIEGTISIDFLNNNFGQYDTSKEMKNATESEGLNLYFDWLVEQGKIPA
jgi:hypothetical protein